MRLTPLIGHGMTALGLDTSRQAAASRSWLVESASVTLNRPALFDPEDLEKVTGVAPLSTREYQMDRLTRSVTTHPAVHVHELRNVTLCAGSLFKWNLVDLVADGPIPWWPSGERVEIDHGVMASTFLGNRFFGHWLLDDVPLALLAEGLGERFGHLGRDNVPSAHQRDYIERFELDVRYCREAFFRRLLVFDYVTESLGKRRRYEALQHALRPAGAGRDSFGLMLMRGTAGTPRWLVNEGEIAEALAARGFRILDPMRCSVSQIVDACHGASVLVGNEGSHLAHGFLPMLPETTVLALQPPFKLDHFWRDRTNCVGGRYSFIVGDAVEHGFRVEPDRVLRMLDRIQSSG